MKTLPTNRKQFHTASRALLVALSFVALVSGCDEEKKSAEPATRVAKSAAAPEPVAPIAKSPPTLVIDESGPQVRGMSAVLKQENGAPNAPGIANLKSYLEDEKEFLEDKEVEIEIARKTPPEFVVIFLSALADLHPQKVTIKTSTRSSYPTTIEFIPQELLKKPKPCSLVGTITKKRGTAIWKLSGGTAHKRARGMSGPDLSMTGETIERMAKKCESDTFFVTAAEGITWGQIYDLAGAGISLEKAGITHAVLSKSALTPGRPVKL